MVEEEERPSLLDVVIEDYNQEKDNRTSRILLTGILDPSITNPTSLMKWHQDFIAALDPRDVRVTGVLFVINGSGVAHLMEASTKVLMSYLGALSTSHQSPDSTKPSAATTATPTPIPTPAPAPAALPSPAPTPFPNAFKSAKILSFTEEVPREYPLWACRAMKMPVDEWVMPTDTIRVVFDTLRHLLELGRELSTMTEEKAMDFVGQNMGRQLTNRIPTVERIASYDTLDDLCSIDDYLQIFSTPIQFTLENEQVWPVEPFLKY